MCCGTGVEQKTTFKSCLRPSALWVLTLESWLWAWQQAPVPAEPSCQAISYPFYAHITLVPVTAPRPCSHCSKWSSPRGLWEQANWLPGSEGWVGRAAVTARGGSGDGPEGWSYAGGELTSIQQGGVREDAVVWTCAHPKLSSVDQSNLGKKGYGMLRTWRQDLPASHLSLIYRLKINRRICLQNKQWFMRNDLWPPYAHTYTYMWYVCANRDREKCRERENAMRRVLA